MGTVATGPRSAKDTVSADGDVEEQTHLSAQAPQDFVVAGSGERTRRPVEAVSVTVPATVAKKAFVANSVSV